MTYDKTIQDGFAPPKDMKYTLIRNMNILLDDKEKKSEAHVVEMSKHRHQKAKSISTTLTHVDKNKTSVCNFFIFIIADNFINIAFYFVIFRIQRNLFRKK
jgi:hypothetical protein